MTEGEKASTPKRLWLLAVVVMVLIAVVILLGSVCSCSTGREPSAMPATESVPTPQSQRSGAAPDFTLDDIGGDEFRLNDHLDGSVVLLYFWATC